jgi:hypothetical protein
MTRISNISQDMKCQYVYDVIDHYSYSNQINKMRRTNEPDILMRMLNYRFEKRTVNILFFSYRKKKEVKSNDLCVIIDK